MSFYHILYQSVCLSISVLFVASARSLDVQLSITQCSSLIQVLYDVCVDKSDRLKVVNYHFVKNYQFS